MAYSFPRLHLSSGLFHLYSLGGAKKSHCSWVPGQTHYLAFLSRPFKPLNPRKMHLQHLYLATSGLANRIFVPCHPPMFYSNPTPPKNPPPSETEFPMSFFKLRISKIIFTKAISKPQAANPTNPRDPDGSRSGAPGNCSHLQTAYREVCSNSHWNSEHPAVKSQGSVAN